MAPRSASTQQQLTELFASIQQFTTELRQEMREEMMAQRAALDDQQANFARQLKALSNRDRLVLEQLQQPRADQLGSPALAPVISRFTHAKPSKGGEKQKIMTLLEQVFVEKDQDDLNIMYKKIDRKVKLVCDFYAEKEENHGKFYKNVSPVDRISLASSVVDKLMKKDEEFQFLLECEGLRPVESLISLCWSNKSKAINKERKQSEE
ncbi:hypothetical protein A0J61_11062 [Choanephora cucurbitarum]|uniref:Uncharacterized protein n=2 Tax=Choanephora cucurbitarum TaxID=101091 RepID=A0A1C7MWS5_9FUNG|nr:hypothetical protein A0J61_11062 [Choanephora cucurbitarum]